MIETEKKLKHECIVYVMSERNMGIERSAISNSSSLVFSLQQQISKKKVR